MMDKISLVANEAMKFSPILAVRRNLVSGLVVLVFCERLIHGAAESGSHPEYQWDVPPGIASKP
jgi:hypothetical protein